MNKLKSLFSVLLLLTAWQAGASQIAFVNVNVVPMSSDTVLYEQTVLITDGIISVVGPVATTEVPDDALVVDGTDRYLMPGLAEMHGHVPGASSADLDRVLTLYAANGVTSVRGMLGQPSHLGLRKELNDGARFGPRLYTSGPSFNGNSVSSPRQAAAMVAAQQDAGYDFLKIHPGLTSAEFRSMAEAANERGIRFAGHVPEDVGLPLALELGISTIDHLDGYMQELIPANVDPSGGFGGFFGVLLASEASLDGIDDLARSTAAAGTWNVPTQSLFEHRVGPDEPELMRAWPEMQYVSAGTVNQWVSNKQALFDDRSFDPAIAERAIDVRRRLIKALHDAGASLLLGSDAPQVFNVPGFSLHRELVYLVSSGLTPYEALLTGTVNSAGWFGWSDRLGTIAAGKEADLVLLDDNPLADIRNAGRVHGVMLQGRWHGREDLDRKLAHYRR